MSAVPDPNSDDGLFGNIKDIFGGLNDLTGGNLGNLAAGAAGIDAASQQKKENTALVQPLKDAATPFLNSGLDQLGNYQNLSPLQQQALNTGVTTGNTLTGEADPLIGIGQDAFEQYKNGTLPAWQQAALDKKIAAAKALNKQALGANVDSSSLGATESGIDTQGLIAQGQLLQANLATGQNAYKQGTDLQQQGGATTKAAYDKAVSDVNQNLQNAINTTLTGLGPLQSAIQIEIAGNTALTGQLQALFGALAKSLSAGGSSSSGGGLGSVVSGLKGLGSLFKGSSTDLGAAGNTAMSGAADIFSGLDTSLPITTPTLGGGAAGGSVDVGPIGETIFGDSSSLAPGVSAGGESLAGLGEGFGSGLADVGASFAAPDLTGLGAEGASQASAAINAANPSTASTVGSYALPIAAAGYTAYGIIRSLSSPGMNNIEGTLNTQTGDVNITAIPGGRGGMLLAQQGVTPADANAYYAPALKAYVQTGSRDAARAALPPPRNAKEQALARYFDQLYTGSDSIFNSIDRELGR